MSTQKEWFENWFDTKFYHILYDERNDEEAELFMQNLISFLGVSTYSQILDMPCGKGRHAIFLNSLGFEVTGADLSSNNLVLARSFERKGLTFVKHDMRDPLQKKYDLIVNLFTSFGYFDDRTNIKVLQHLKNALTENGLLVIDFLNVVQTKNNLVSGETISKGGIKFHINRCIENGFITKKIAFEYHDNSYHFEERVKYINLSQFMTYFAQANLKVKHMFGDYHLREFDEKNSERLIMILE